MGLDMYLDKRHYVQRWDHIPDKQQFAVIIARGGEPYPTIRPERITYVIEQVAYWRKANAIHHWFVENVQDGEDDGREYNVTVEQLRQLLHTTNEALAAYRRGDNTSGILPTMDGFFFGSTYYDKGYEDDLLETQRQISAILEECSDMADYYYRASW